MKYFEVKNYEMLSSMAADLIANQLERKPNSILGLATGSTPIGTYQELIRRCKAGKVDFSKVTSVNLDEYVGLDGSNDQSYRYFMNTNLFDHVNIDKSKTNVPNGCATDLQAECKRYDDLIESQGGIDLQVLGIGLDGHIGFNEPFESFVAPTHVVDLEESTIEANSRFFANKDLVPRRAVTMGIRPIMLAKKIILIANGENKRDIVEKSMHGPVTPYVPASILQFHPDCTVITCG